MRYNKYLGLIISLSILLFSNVYADNKNQNLEAEKVYVVYVKSSSKKGGSIITNASSQKFLGSDYFVGKSIRLKNATIRIPVVNITHIMEYKNKRAWEESVEDYNKKWPRKKDAEEEVLSKPAS